MSARDIIRNAIAAFRPLSTYVDFDTAAVRAVDALTSAGYCIVSATSKHLEDFSAIRMLMDLDELGYRILAPGEMDRETLEAAKKAKCDGCAQEIPLNECGFHQNGTVTTPCHSAAIRALGGGE